MRGREGLRLCMQDKVDFAPVVELQYVAIDVNVQI